MKRFLLLTFLFCLGKMALAQVPETEPNNSFATANPVARYEVKTATSNTTTDPNDYFRAILPEDGTLKVYVQATCTGSSGSGWLYFYSYDRRKANTITDLYIANNTNVPVGVTVFDTITLYGMAADTVYFRFNTNKSFNYQFSYSITDITPNDAEPNNSFATALPIALNEVKEGHIRYYADGGAFDTDDYYRAILGADGTVRLYADGINQGTAGGWMYLYVYDRRKTSVIFDKYLGNTSNINRGTQFKDTITLYGMAADTVYFRLTTNGQAFSYSLRYNQTDLTPNDVEPNGSFTTALPITINETKQGHSRYFANGATDDDFDFYRAILPADGTLKLYLDATNQGSTNGWMYLSVFDRRKSVSIFDKYVGNSSNISRGTQFKDTITIYGLAADTVYFRFYTNGQAFSYSLRYNQTDITPNDVEPNGTFATALPLAMGETKQGHIRYFAAGSTDDDFDFYRITPPYDGTHKIYVEATNQGSASGWLYASVFDRRKTTSIFDKYVGNNTAVPRGATIRDTITVYGQAADTSFIRLYTNGQGFSYKLRYEVVDTSLNDIEPNGTFATALNLSGGQPQLGHINYAFNGTTDVFDYYKTEFASNDSLKLYIQATNTAGKPANFYVYGYNAAQSNIYTRERYSVPAGATIFDSVKIAVTAPQTIYNRVWGNGEAFTYQLTLNSRLPGNGFSILGKGTACTHTTTYKAINMAPSDAGVVYHWAVSGGGTINFTDSIATVAWTTPGTYLVSLYTSNANGNSVTKKLSVIVSAGSPPAAPIIAVKGRYLDIAALPAGAIRQWYKDGTILTGVTDSVYYAAAAGSYTATYVNDCGESIQSAAVVMSTPQAQTITFPAITHIIFSPDSLRKLAATASSGLPVSYKIISGPGTISNDTLRPTAYGNIVVQALQYGSATYDQASPVSITINVVKGPQTITFDSIPNQVYTANASFALSVSTSSGLPISFQIVSGPATISGNLLKMTGVGLVQVKARQTGNANYNAAPEITRNFCIGLREISAITGVTTACVSTQRYTTKKIAGALYQWSLDGGGILTSSGDTAIVQWQTGGTHILSVKGYSACDTVRSAVQTLSVFVDTAYNVATPTGLTSANNSTGLSLPLTLQWSPAAKATSYDLYVWPVGFDQPALPLDSNLVQVNYTLNENIALNQPYNWRVMAKNICSSAQSAVQQFTVAEINNTLPDLVLDTFYFSQPLYQGQPVTVTWRVKNIGTKGTGSDAWKDRIYISPSASIRVSESTLLGTFNNPSYLLPGETYTQTKTVTIPPGFGGNWWLSVITDNVEAFCFTEACNVFWGPGYYNHGGQTVVERSEYNNYRRSLIPILDGTVPDLQVKSIGVLGAAFGGSTITVTYNVKNEGTSVAVGKKITDCPQRGWIDRFFISSYPTFNISTAKELEAQEVIFYKPGTTSCQTETLPYVDYLPKDSSYTIQHQLLIPYDNFGKQYIYVWTNGGNDAYEGTFNTNNIRRSDSINITITPPADLVVTNIQPVPNVNSGEQLTIDWTVTNQGANVPLELAWQDSVFVCSSATFSPANVLVAGAANIRRPSDFATGFSYNKQVRLTIPNGVSGTYYVFVKTDARSEVFEFSQENNNTLRSNAFVVNMTTPGDFMVTNISAPDSITAEVPFSITYTVKNIGAGKLGGIWSDRIYISQDSLPGTAGTILVENRHVYDTIVAGAQRNYVVQAKVQAYMQLANKRTFLKVHTNFDNGVYEHNATGNNVSVSLPPTGAGSLYVKPGITADTLRQADIAIQSFTAPAAFTANTSINANWLVKNIGTQPTNKTYWFDYVFLSADTTINSGDRELKRTYIDKYVNTGMQPDSQYQRTAVLQMPIDVYGNYYLICRTDASNQVTNDSINTNNTVVLPVQITPAPTPNLLITITGNLPDSVWGGSAFWLHYTVQNTGTVTTPAERWTDNLYINQYGVPYGGSNGYKYHFGTLAPGASYADSLLVEIPNYINGNYSLIASTDINGVVYEGPGGKGNNYAARAKNILPYNSRPAPDLIVSNVAMPDSVKIGKDLTAAFTITNMGGQPAIGRLANALYLSSNKIFESNADKLTGTTDSAYYSLAPGQSRTGTITGKAVPDMPGNHYGIVRANVRNTLYEGAYLQNNIAASDTTVNIDARAITLGNAITDTLLPGNGNYYKVTVPADADLVVDLSTSASVTGGNALQVAYSRVPSEISFDASGIVPGSLNQKALLSGTQAGTYYIKAQSVGVAVPERVSLVVQALPYSIISVTPAVAGKGVVSGAVYGGGFKPGIQVKLRSGANTYSVGTITKMISSMALQTEWHLENVPVGVYDVVAINPGGAEAVLAGAITVQASTGYLLEYTSLMPSEIRPFGAVFTYKGKNTGNVNIPVVHGDITMKAENATVYAVHTTGKLKRQTQYFSQYDSLMTEDWYLSGKNRVVPFIGRNIAPGEEFTITIDARFNRNSIRDQQRVFPLQCRMFGYSAADFTREQVRVLEIMRLLILNHPSAPTVNNAVVRKTREGSKPFIERMMQEYVNAGLLFWNDTIGTNLRYECSRCLRNLPEARPANDQDTFTYNPGGYYITGTKTLSGNQAVAPGNSYLLEMNRSHYWADAERAGGQAGTNRGWDLLKVEGALNFQATSQRRFVVYPSSLFEDYFNDQNVPGQLRGWSPAYDTSFAIITATGGVTGFDSSKYAIDLRYFASACDMKGGNFSLKLSPDNKTIYLVFTAHKPGPGENGVDGVDAAVGDPGSPGGNGGVGNAAHPQGGRGGRGGNGGNEYAGLVGKGGRGGNGAQGWGPGGYGGPGGRGGEGINNGRTGAPGGDGGNGGNAGQTGGRGGDGAPGGPGGNGGPKALAGMGGDGGDAGNGTGAAYGGNGGNGGEGGKGGDGCGVTLAVGGGVGGEKGMGPLGPGINGANGTKGKPGNDLNCGCGEKLAPSFNPNDIAAGIIDQGKATIGALKSAGEGDGLLSVSGQVFDYLDQTSKESAPIIPVLTAATDATMAAWKLFVASESLTWEAGCKVAVAGLKVGDYINRQIYGSSTYVGSTEVNNLIDLVKNVSSVPDALAYLAKEGLKGSGAATMVEPCDPNEITGPAGYSEARRISATATMPYSIHFENDSLLAQVAAQRVVVRQKISPKADPLTFKVGDFHFGGKTFTVPADRSNYVTVINMDSLGYRVEVSAGVDVVNREAFWIFQTIDPQTGLAPANVFTGFLPVNDTESNGSGYVNYSIKPLATDITGDSITAKASIVFDQNEPIETNTWINIVDAVAPASSLNSLPATSNTPIVNIRYSGTDDAGGSGIKHVDLYMSDNSAAPILFARAFTATDTLFYGEQGHTYTFYGQATDHVGNKEVLKPLGSVTITSTSCLGGVLSFTSNVSGNTYQWQVNTGSGFTNVNNGGVYSNATNKTLVVTGAGGSYYGYQYRALANGNTYSDVFTLRFATFWEGTVSKAWEDGANWSCGTVPNEFTDVVVPSNKARFPEVTTPVIIRSLRANTGATVTVKTGANITVLK